MLNSKQNRIVQAKYFVSKTEKIYYYSNAIKQTCLRLAQN